MTDLEFYPVVHYAMVGMPSWTDSTKEYLCTLCAIEARIDQMQGRNWKGMKRKK